MEGGHKDLGKRVAVVGAGDVAKDCVRTAARQPGVEEVVLIYRRTELICQLPKKKSTSRLKATKSWN